MTAAVRKHRCTCNGYHLASRTWDESSPQQRAKQLADELNAMDAEHIDAGVVTSAPCVDDLCEHKHGCDVIGSTLVTSTDSLTGKQHQNYYCPEHVRTVLGWLIEDPHRSESTNPHIDVEIRVYR